MIVRSKRQTGQVRSPYLRHALRHASLACAGVLMSVALNAWPATPDAAGASAPGASAADVAPVRYTVQPGQSVTDIAEEITQSHDRATRDRMAAALFKANPGAFMGNDPDRLKIGATLVVPGAAGAGAASAAAVSSPSSASAPAATAPALASSTAAPATQAASSPAQPEAPHETASSTAAAPAAPLAASSSEHGRAWSGSIQTSNGSGLSAGSSITGMRGSTEASTGSVFSTQQEAASSVHSSGVSGPGAAVAPAAATPGHGTVSSLEQLLALKNRVLTALEKHGAGTAPASSAGVTAGSSAPTAAPAPPATAALPGTTQAGVVPASAPAAAGLEQPAERSQSWLTNPLLLPVLGLIALILLVALFLTWIWRPRSGSEHAALAQPAPSPLPGSASAQASISPPASARVPAPTSDVASTPATPLDNSPPRQAEIVPAVPSSPASAIGAVPPVPADGAVPPMPEAVRAAFGEIDLSLPELPPLADEGVTQAPAIASEPVPMAEAGQASAAGEPHPEAPAGQQETPASTPADDVAPAFAPPPTLHPQPDHAGAAAETGPASVAGLGAAGFGALDLNFDLESPAGAAQPATPFSDSDIATIARNKLDLAIEYVKLGDVAGARTLITEVIESNDAATQIQARTLLASLAALS